MENNGCYDKSLCLQKKIYEWRSRQLAVVMFILLLCFAPAIPLRASGEPDDKITVRVGFFPMEGLNQQSEDGSKSGYGYDFLQMLAPYGNFQYEYVGYDKSWSDKEHMLLDDEIDMVVWVKKTPEREKIFDFSKKNIGSSHTLLTVRPDNKKYTTEDYSTLEGIRIGFLKGSSRDISFASYAAEHGFTYEPVYYNNQDEMDKALLEKKEIDGIASNGLRILGKETVLDQFGKEDFYIAVKKGNDELLERIDSALARLDIGTPDWILSLDEKYQNRSAYGKNLLLSAEEKRCIQELNKSGKKLKVMLNPDLAPYSYLEDGKPKGIFVSLLEMTAEEADIPYEIMDVTSNQEYLEIMQNGGADLIFDAAFDYNTAEEAGYYLTSPYYTATYSRITRNNDNTKTDVSAIRDSGGLLGDRYLAPYMNEKTVKCETFDKCVQAVQSGQVDCAYVFNYTASKYVGSDFTNAFTHELVKGISCPIAVAVRSDLGRPLYSVLDKLASNMNSEKRDAAINANTQYNVRNKGLLYFVYNDPVTVIFAVVIMMMGIVVMVLWFRMRERKAEQINREKDIRQNEALKAAYDAANRASHAKSDFLSKMSHDIRTPLNAIIGTVAIAGAHVEEPKRVSDCLSKITSSSRHLLGLINEILDMSRLESGKMVLSEEEFNLANLMDNLVELVQPGIKTKSHELIVRILDIRHENVIGDSLRIQQAFVNIVGNATKYTPDGGKIEIDISELPSKAPKIGTYQFVFKDNGIGMSKEFVTTIFDPFSREKDSRIDKIQGTGLGMAITKNIVQMMDGSITVESEQGVGSTFTVIIRLKLQDKEMGNAEELAGLPVLVVDDDRNICESTCLILNEIGMESEYVLSGVKAVDKVVKRHENDDDYYAVIIDWKMPDMDGLETAKAIRKVVGEEITIIILTAYDWSDIEEEAKHAGVTAFVSKPLFKSKLMYLFDEIIHKDDQRREESGLDLFRQMDFSHNHLLLVEDNELNREIACEIIEMSGMQVDTAENGEIAVQKFKKSPLYYYDMIFMDVQMPVMNGYDATLSIRSMERPDAQKVPIIALTANAFVEDVEKAMAAKMNEHLAKPLDISKLAEVMNRWIPHQS